MPSLSDLLGKFNLKYEDLTVAERATLTDWMQKLSDRQLRVEDIKNHVSDLITGVERALVELDEPKTFWSLRFHRKRDLHLKARLKNYLMLQDFLTGPDKAKAWIEQQLSNIKPQ